MGIKQKTVFISYRRTNFYTALAVYQDLTANGYDVFFDYQSIDSGDFEQVIFENIQYRAHFVLILSPSALERLKDPNSIMRREVEMAIDTKRNIIPLMMEGFDFSSPSAKEALTGKLSILPNYNGLSLIPEYLLAGMEKLRKRYLSISLEDIPEIALSNDTEEITEHTNETTRQLSPVKSDTLIAQEFIERGRSLQNTKEYERAIKAYSIAIELDKNLPEAFQLRGGLFALTGSVEKAITDLKKVQSLEQVNLVKNNIEIVGDRNIIGHNNVVSISYLNEDQRLANEIENRLSQNRFIPYTERSTEGENSIFISYASEDRDLAKDIYNRLMNDGFNPWLDEEKILPGEDWDAAISKAIENTDFVLMLISSNSITKDGYIQKELRKILDVASEKPPEKIFRIPVKLEECTMPRQLQGLQFLKYFPEKSRDNAYKRLLKSLK